MIRTVVLVAVVLLGGAGLRQCDRPCPPARQVSVDQCAPASDPFLSDDATLISIP